MEMKEQTKAVKQSLLRAGFDQNNLSVKRGTGTARCWIHVSMDIHRATECYCGEPDIDGRRETCHPCRDKISKIRSMVEDLTLKASGREHDNYQAVLIQVAFKN